MKFEIGSALSGLWLAAGAVLAQFGTTWEAVLLAVAGAGLAVWELEVKHRRTVVTLLGFNLIVGALGAPVIVEELGLNHKAALAVMAFAVGYAGHDLFVALREAVRAAVRKRLGK